LFRLFTGSLIVKKIKNCLSGLTNPGFGFENYLDKTRGRLKAEAASFMK